MKELDYKTRKLYVVLNWV